MNKESYSSDEIKEIQKETEISDLNFKAGGAVEVEGGRLEITADQIEATRKEMEEALQDGDISQENVESVNGILEKGRNAGESYLTDQENRELLEKKAEKREFRDKVIAGAASAGILGIFGVGAYLGMDIGNMGLESVAGKAMAGFTLIGGATMFSPFAKIQNWLERKKYKKEGKI